MLDVKTVSRGACFADYDNDGKMDAFVVNLGAPGTLLHNVSQNTNHWIAVKLKGTKSNRDGIGARLELLAGGTQADRGAHLRDPDISRRTMAACTSAWARHAKSTSSRSIGRAGRSRLSKIWRSIACYRWRSRR